MNKAMMFLSFPCILLFGLAGKVAFAEPGTVTGSQPSIFILNAARGSLSGSSDGGLNITLRGVENDLSLLSYKPFMDARSERVTVLFDGLTNIFKTSTPRALLSFKKVGKNKRETILVTLSNPSYQVNKRVARFNAKPVVGSSSVSDILYGANEKMTRKLPVNMLSVSLVIEAAYGAAYPLTENTSMYCEGVSTAAASCSFLINGATYFMFALTRSVPVVRVPYTLGNGTAQLHKGSEYTMLINKDLSYTILFIGSVTDSGSEYSFGDQIYSSSQNNILSQ